MKLGEMTKKHEELAEEIAESIAYHCHCPWSGASVGDRELSRRIITLILSAFHDGRLDEELGVVGRGYVEKTWHQNGRGFFVRGYIKSREHIEDGTEMPSIALRKEEE